MRSIVTLLNARKILDEAFTSQRSRLCFPRNPCRKIHDHLLCAQGVDTELALSFSSSHFSLSTVYNQREEISLVGEPGQYLLSNVVTSLLLSDFRWMVPYPEESHVRVVPS